MPTLDDLAAEVQRCRDRLHSLESRMAGVEMVSKQAVEGLTRATAIMDSLAKQVEQLSTRERIEEAVAEAINKRGPVFPLSWTVRIAGSIAGAVAVVGGIKGLIG